MKRFLLLILLSVGFTNVSYAITSEEICKGEHSLSEDDKTSLLKQRGVLCFYGNVKKITNTGNLNVKIPENARSSNASLGWQCNKDFRQVDASKCIPDMSDVDSSSMGWKCKSGYSIYQTVTGAKNCRIIKKLKIPQNAFASGDKWFCKSGYAKVGTQCLKANRPFEIWTNDALCNFVEKKKANAGYLAELKIRNARCKMPRELGGSWSDSWNWECNDGYLSKDDDWGDRNSCVKGKVTNEIPEYARKSDTPLGWKCQAGYEKTLFSSCIPENAELIKLPSNEWNCKKGYARIESFKTGKESCRKLAENKHIPKNAKASITPTVMEDWQSFYNAMFVDPDPDVSIKLTNNFGLAASNPYGQDLSSCFYKGELSFKDGNFILRWLSCSEWLTNYSKPDEIIKGSYRIIGEDSLATWSNIFPEIELTYFRTYKILDKIIFDSDLSDVEIVFNANLSHTGPESLFSKTTKIYKITNLQDLNLKKQIGWACNAGFKKSDNKCIKKKNKLATPSYRN